MKKNLERWSQIRSRLTTMHALLLCYNYSPGIRRALLGCLTNKCSDINQRGLTQIWCCNCNCTLVIFKLMTGTLAVLDRYLVVVKDHESNHAATSGSPSWSRRGILFQIKRSPIRKWILTSTSVLTGWSVQRFIDGAKHQLGLVQ